MAQLNITSFVIPAGGGTNNVKLMYIVPYFFENLLSTSDIVSFLFFKHN